MTTGGWNHRRQWILALMGFVMVALTAVPAPAQDDAGATTLPAVKTVEVATLQSVEIWPELGGVGLAWFAAVVILTVTFRVRPLFSLRNLDGFILAGTCLLLARRLETTAGIGGHTCQWWSYLGLTIVAVYWLLRGFGLLLAKRIVRPAAALPTGAAVVLLVSGLIICAHHIASAPVSQGAVDGTLGGLHTLETGKLPYGDMAGGDNRSPLLYAVCAAAARVAEPTVALGDDALANESGVVDRTVWIHDAGEKGFDLATERLVNAALFVGMFLGLYVIGRRLHGGESALPLLAIFCVFPGTLECLSRPEIMLPAMLLTWTLAFALLPGVGGLLATLSLVLAGVAWPWAWLGLPVLLGYFWRRGWHAFGATVGLLGGVALVAYGLLNFVEPTIPRTGGAMLAAGRQPTWTVTRAEDGTLMPVQRDVPAEIESPSLTKPVWQILVNAGTRPIERSANGHSLQIDWPKPGEDAPVYYHQLEPDTEALPILTAHYRQSLVEARPVTQLAAAVRTVLEATWFPVTDAPPETPAVWDVWSGATDGKTGGLVMWRRIAKLVAGLLAVWAALAIFFGKRTRPRQLAGGLLIVAAGTLLASSVGAVTNLVWLLPLVLVLWAVHEGGTEVVSATRAVSRRTSPPAFAGLTFPRGPEPRISTEAPDPIKLADTPEEPTTPPGPPDGEK